jgi:Ca2+/H+ antiporter, TMEM165/GDT1 family
MNLWIHAGPSILAAFLASFVEFVEALTIVLAVGTVRGWRPALIGAGAGALLLLVLVVALGPALGLIPIDAVRLVVGLLLLLFGMRWLRKAILRAAGFIPLHDETAAFAAETAGLIAAGQAPASALDWVAIITTFKAVVLEGIEVVFIVIGIGATSGLLLPAGLGAAIAGLLVIVLGLVLHRPLARIPENTLKFAVGVMISAFGIFWLSEGMGFPWPGADLALPLLAAGLLGVALGAVQLLRLRRARAVARSS